MLNKSLIAKSILAMLMLVTCLAHGQVIQAPVIKCIDNLVGINNVRITWLPSTNTCGSFNEYRLYGAPDRSGPYTLINVFDYENEETYEHNSALVTSSTWYYYMEADYDCQGFTILQSDTISNTEPSTAEIVRVTVENGYAIVYWKQSDNPLTHSYEVNYFLDTNQFDAFDNVIGRSDTVYIDTVRDFDPNLESLSFIVQEFDSCKNNHGDPVLSNQPHQTIFLETNLDSCEREITLNWNEYINWNDPQNPGVDHYEIWYKRNNSIWFRDTIVDSTTLDYSFNKFSDFDDLYFIVRAVSNANDSLYSNSNMVQVYAKIVQPPTYFFLHQLSVAGASVQIGVTIDPGAEIERLQVWRGKDTTEMKRIAQVQAAGNHIEELVFIDSTINPNKGPYWYQVRAYDVCGRKYSTTYGQFIRLGAIQTDFFENVLEWNQYHIKDQELETIRLYRDEGNGLELYRELLADDLDYLDDISELYSQSGKFCYMIEATYSVSPGNYGETKENLVTRSNIKCIDERPVIYVPNAFAPEGLNNVFKPAIIFSDLSNYSMKIISKEGKLLFQTFDPDQGWDGTLDGAKMPSGGYAYHIRINALDGRNIEETGILILVR